MRKINKYIISIITIAILAGGLYQAPSTALAADPDKMEVHFIDVGQGDATLIKCGEHAMLIDAGDDSKGTAVQNYLKKQNVDKLDYLVLTHPDADHIGGAPTIITKFEIKKVFVSNYEKDNKSYQKLIQALDDKDVNYLTPRVGWRYYLGTALITILAPNKEYNNPNDASVSLVIKNGDNKFIFSGDAGEDAEKDILDNDIDISADVYHVAHHGSKTSTSKDFLKAINPDYAVISCAEGNSYGHPHAETLNTLRTNGVKVYRTDEAGSIIATADGKNITFSVPASETWKAGEPTGSANTAKISNGKTTQSSDTQSGKSSNKEVTSEVKEPVPETSASNTTELTYVLNVKTMKFHKPSCNSLPTSNRKDTSESRESIIAQGYVPCKKCNP
ncbi:MAG: MBL fold metallo-hydrolase [Lachnospiraceae bacterium]|nr:MBL fold metallo-hydrolase [Lachnospiraceae bacterium]